MDRFGSRTLLTLLLLAVALPASAGKPRPPKPAQGSTAFIGPETAPAPVRVLDAREHVLDRNGDGRPDALEIEVDLVSDRERPSRTSGWIEVPGSPVPREFVESLDHLTPSPGTARLVFDTSRLHRARVDGPYIVHLVTEWSPRGRIEQTLATRAYRAREFEAPDLALRPGTVRGHLVVAIGPYGAQRYRVELPVEVRLPGLFACRAILRGEDVTAGGYAETMLEAGAQRVTLDFGANPGLVDAPGAPWTLADCECANGAGVPQWEPVTLAIGDSLAPADFRDTHGDAMRTDGAPRLVAVDDDDDSMLDALEYLVPLQMRAAGEVRVFASLARGGQVIADREIVEPVTAGRCTLAVRFAGARIYAAGGSGPLVVSGAFAFAASRVGWPDVGLALGAARADSVAAGRFTPGAGISGRVLAGGRPVDRSVVQLERSLTGSVTTGPDGAFRLHAPDEAGRRLELRIDPREGSRLGWRVFVDGRLVSTSGKADVVLEPGRELSVSFEHD